MVWYTEQSRKIYTNSKYEKISESLTKFFITFHWFSSNAPMVLFRQFMQNTPFSIWWPHFILSCHILTNHELTATLYVMPLKKLCTKIQSDLLYSTVNLGSKEKWQQDSSSDLEGFFQNGPMAPSKKIQWAILNFNGPCYHMNGPYYHMNGPYYHMNGPYYHMNGPYYHMNGPYYHMNGPL